MTARDRAAIEGRILSLLAAGCTDATIADITALSVRTVRRYVASYCERVGARSRFQAGMLAARRGDIEYVE